MKGRMSVRAVKRFPNECDVSLTICQRSNLRALRSA
jgi:hypothetical protein